jgi:hypothetical protein
MAGGLEFAAGSLDLAADDGTGGLVIQNPQVLDPVLARFSAPLWSSKEMSKSGRNVG